MKQNYGKLRRKFTTEQPAVFVRETREVNIDYQASKHADNEGGEVEGFEGFTVQIDPNISDYGHVKSQLVEAAYSPKDEFGLLFNAFGALEAKVSGDDFDRSALDEFAEVNAWREMCATAAKAVIDSLK